MSDNIFGISGARGSDGGEAAFPACLGVRTYPNLRADLHSGDVVTWVGDGVLSQAIRRFEPGGSHTSMLLVLYGNTFLVEAMEDGIVLNRASERFSNFEGDILVHPMGLDDRQRFQMEGLALNLISAHIGYGFATLLKLAASSVRLTMDRPVCSQTVAYMLAHVGAIKPFEEVPSPGDLRAVLPAPWKLAAYTKEAE